jgi:CubicO group peptidase (beta-lactamase class C family)
VLGLVNTLAVWVICRCAIVAVRRQSMRKSRRATIANRMTAATSEAAIPAREFRLRSIDFLPMKLQVLYDCCGEDLPFALQRDDVAGAVVVVKDGMVLLQKGYGYADVASRRPVGGQHTLFRPGSVSKLFAWTAVMHPTPTFSAL